MKALLIRGARQLLTLHGPREPRRGAALRELGIIADGAVLARGGVIEEVGPTRRVGNLALARGAEEIDATGRVVMPGFIDSHTHLVNGGPWLDDYEARLGGAAALEAMTGWKAGVQRLRTTSVRLLEAQARSTLDGMARHGTTAVEAKSGYGNDPSADQKVLRVLARLDQRPLDVARTFLAMGPLWAAGHGRPSAPDLDRLSAQFLPVVARRKSAGFVDLCVEGGDSELAAAARYLGAARHLGLMLKVHAEQFHRTGAALLAVRFGAVSVDHLEYAERQDVEALAASSTIATLLPGSVFHLRSGRHAPARELVEAGAAIALASGFNPNSGPSYSMPAMVSLACSELALTPAEAISAATINAAHALRRAGHLGSLELGKSADLIILNASDYREIPYRLGVNQVHTTVKRGKVVYREGAVGA